MLRAVGGVLLVLCSLRSGDACDKSDVRRQRDLDKFVVYFEEHLALIEQAAVLSI